MGHSLIHRITQTAQAIGAERDFERRVAHEGPTDEVGQLAVTFNDMLAELESGYRQLEGALQSQRRFVADTGPGIPPAALPHIFERFYRGEVSRSGTSAGLGLSIAMELVERQEGTLTVESEPGQGSTFTVTLRQAPA